MKDSLLQSLRTSFQNVSKYRTVSTLRGCIEGIAQGIVFGWAVHRSRPQEPLRLDVIVDGRNIGQTETSIVRPSIECSAPSGYLCGFQFDLRPHIHALCGQELQIQEASCGTPLGSGPVTLDPRGAWGVLEAMDGLEIGGWVVIAGPHAGPSIVDIFVDGESAGSVIADRPRPDLFRVGLTQVNCGFRFTVPCRWNDGERHLITADIQNAQNELRGNGIPYLCRIKGDIEVVTKSRVSGWILNCFAPQKPIPFDLWINGHCIVKRILPHLLRTDVEEKLGFVEGRNPIGFDVELPPQMEWNDTAKAVVLCLPDTREDLLDPHSATRLHQSPVPEMGNDREFSGESDEDSGDTPVYLPDLTVRRGSPPDSIRLADTFFFIHIPKTAGTSFRIAAEKNFGWGYIHLDYGRDSHETSQLVKRKIYESSDLFSLALSLSEDRCKFFGGHVRASKYAMLFSAEKMVTFVRDPVKQVLSQYEHLTYHAGYAKSLDEYLAGLSERPDLAAGFLRGIPLEVYGFVGVTELYAESLEVFNKTYGTCFPLLEENVNPQGGAEKYSDCDEILSQVALRLDPRSTALYTRAVDLLKTRVRAQAEGWDYVHGAIGAVTPYSIRGFAYRSKNSGKPVQVQLWVNDRLHAAKEATELRSHLRNFNVPRNGFVGFRFRLRKPLRTGDLVRCTVYETGQTLGETVFVPKK